MGKTSLGRELIIHGNDVCYECHNYKENCSCPKLQPMPMGVGNHSCKYRDFADWIISLDDLDMLAVRRSLTLSYIIEKAKSTKT